MEITRDLHQIQVPLPDNPLGCVNVYAIRADDGWTIVDTGFPTDEAYDSLTTQVRELAGDLANLKTIIITHWHHDHFGLAMRLQAESGAQIVIHEVEVEFINGLMANRLEDRKRITDWLLLNGANSVGTAMLNPPPLKGNSANGGAFRPDVTLRGGERLSIGKFNFDVIWTPGHSDGHICLHEPAERILISGDHILPIITPAINYYARTKGNPLARFLNSLDLVKDLEVTTVLPAHEHIFHDLRGRVEQLQIHHKERGEAIMEAMGNSAQSAWDISSQIPWAEGLWKWNEMPEMHKTLAIMETLAHLFHLSFEDHVERISEDGLYKWKRLR